jgi:uracil-DNA glycosylase family 4
MIPKPQECTGCTLYDRGNGFAHPYGNKESNLVVIAEALGKNEALQGIPLVGEAGVYWQRALGRLGLAKDSLYIGNTVNCQPPNNWLTGSPWEQSAIAHCSVHRKKLYEGGGKVFLTMGVVATRTVLKELLNVDYRGELENWHGYVIGPKPDGPFVIPTFHPSFVLQGNHDLFGCFLFDTKRAMEVATFGSHQVDPVQLIVDPPPSYFADYVQQIPDDPSAWLAVDTETHMGGTGGFLPDGTKIGRITRFNFAMHPDQGVTVPNEERYRFAIQSTLNKKATKIFWNERFDLGEFKRAGFSYEGETYDGMWAWHMLQSALPKGLGFVAPFYSNIEPWKHLNVDEPGRYAAIDAVQTLRIMIGLKKDLQKSGQWESFLKYATQLDHQALYPMEAEGIGVSKSNLQLMQRAMEQSTTAILEMIQQQVPIDALPWDGGWKRQPNHIPNAFLGTIKERVIVCRTCKAQDVTPTHRCAASPSTP